MSITSLVGWGRPSVSLSHIEVVELNPMSLLSKRNRLLETIKVMLRLGPVAACLFNLAVRVVNHDARALVT